MPGNDSEKIQALVYKNTTGAIMGIDVHVLNFLRHAKLQSSFNSTVTIGRQGIHLPQDFLDKLSKSEKKYKTDDFCEEFLKSEFGSTTVDSIDNSPYEGASIIHDMNLPIAPNLLEKYDTIIDGGCLEHIFDIKQALSNCSNLCRVGGQIIHILPADNFCGHGFWQFSPELFASLYTPDNGYRETEIFLASLEDTSNWYVAEKMGKGKRFEISSAAPVYILARTVLARRNPSIKVQQSDYEHLWTKTESKDCAAIENDAPPINESNLIKPQEHRPRSFFEALTSIFKKHPAPQPDSSEEKPAIVGKNLRLKRISVDF